MAACAQFYSSSWSLPCLLRTWQLVRRLTAVRSLQRVWWDHGAKFAVSQQFVVSTLSVEIMAACAQTHSILWFSNLCEEIMSACAQTKSSLWFVPYLVRTSDSGAGCNKYIDLGVTVYHTNAFVYRQWPIRILKIWPSFACTTPTKRPHLLLPSYWWASIISNI
jgi:hypothetical protein